ncbi:pcs-1 [Symbiodinium sp. CCMP2592]|nr:pcs-1 [Symbiodinium sp. CCMP2592]
MSEANRSSTMLQQAEAVIIPHGLFTQGLSFQNCSIMLQVLGHGRLRISERSSSNEAQISDQLRQDLAEAFEEGGMVCVLVNYTRLGGGHWSPLGGWSAGHVLILDTNDMRLPPHWVKVETLTKSMCSLNRATGNPRGYLLLRREEADST